MYATQKYFLLFFIYTCNISFSCSSSLQAQVNEKIGIPFHNKPWKKVKK